MLPGSGLGRGQDQPVVQVPEKTNPTGVGPSRHCREDSGEDLQGSRQPKAQDFELMDRPVRNKTEPFPGGDVDGYLEVVGWPKAPATCVHTTIGGSRFGLGLARTA